MTSAITVYARTMGIAFPSFGVNPPTAPLTWFWTFYLVSLMFSWLYTVCVGDVAAMWRSTAVAPMNVQGLFKVRVYTHYIPGIREKYAFLSRVYESNLDKNTVNYWLLRKWSGRIEPIVKYGWIPVSLTCFLFIAHPLWVFFLRGERFLMLEFYLFGIDYVNSLTGFMLHNLYHIGAVVLGLTGTCGADLMLLLLVLHVWPLADIWRHMWQTLNDALAHPMQCNSRQRRAYFRNMLHMHREMFCYMEDLSSYYESMTFCEVYTCSGMLCAVLYCHLMVGLC